MSGSVGGPAPAATQTPAPTPTRPPLRTAIDAGAAAVASGRRRPSFLRELTVAFLAVALLPVALFGLIALERTQSMLRDDADGRVQGALDRAEALFARDQRDLATTVSSYATWSRLEAEVAALSLDDARAEVLDFLVGRGTATAAVLVVGSESTSAGPPATVEALAGLAQQALAATPAQAGTDIGPGYVSLGDGVYRLAIDRVDLTGSEGPGVAPAGPQGAALAIAQRLDPVAVAAVRQAVGFDAAIADATGRVVVATDASAVSAVTPLLAAALRGASGVGQNGGLATGSLPVRAADGTVVGALLLSADLAATSMLRSQLGVLVGVSLAAALLLALALVFVLRRRLGRRVGRLEEALAALDAGAAALPGAGTLPGPPIFVGPVAAPEPPPAGDLDRVQGKLDAVVARLDRRERTLQAALAAVAGLSPALGRDAVAAASVDGGRSVFGLNACAVLDASGTPQAASPSPPDWFAARAAAPFVVEAPMAENAADSSVPRLAGVPADPESWGAADGALFGLFARMAGVAIRDADLIGRSEARAHDLDRLARFQADFLRGVGHNLQGPLTSMLLVADDLATDRGLDAARRERAAVLQRQARRLARMVEQLLTDSRLDAGALNLDAEPVAVGRVAQRIWAGFGADRPFRVIDESGGMLAVGDRSAIEQVLWMLLDNAVRYAPTGPVTVRIRPRPGGRGQPRLRFSVEDTGPGVPRAERRRIFERFARGSTAAGREGTGLGLDVARGLVRAMGGRISCVAAPGGGAAFVVTLPGEAPAEL